jgi:DNA-binding CsgD family transcriptional regulator/pimeloyl-ACP methyl ester carboxylesterase
MAGGPWNHIELWEADECRDWYQRLSKNRMLVRYDIRGTGHSDRGLSDYSLEAQVGDLRAVVKALELQAFDVFAAADSGPVAVAYAAANPERLSHLILWCTWHRGPEIVGSDRIRAWRGLIDEDWELMTDTCAHLAFGWSGGEISSLSAKHLRESVTQDDAREALNATGTFDVTDLLPEVRTPTLVIHRRSIPWLPVRAANHLTSGMKNAQLTLLDGEWTAPYLGDTDAAVTAIDEFLGVGDEQESGKVQTAGRDVIISGSDTDRLTEREIEVLRLVASGRTNSEIADELVLSVRTVERHVQNVYGKIGAKRRAEATAYALTRGVV